MLGKNLARSLAHDNMGRYKRNMTQSMKACLEGERVYQVADRARHELHDNEQLSRAGQHDRCIVLSDVA